MRTLKEYAEVMIRKEQARYHAKRLEDMLDDENGGKGAHWTTTMDEYKRRAKLFEDLGDGAAIGSGWIMTGKEKEERLKWRAFAKLFDEHGICYPDEDNPKVIYV